MKLTKKTAMLFAGMGLLLGSIGAIGLQVHAQQTPSTTEAVKTTAVQTIVSPVTAPAEVINPVDTDNVQSEVKDANEVKGVETNDKNEAKDVAGVKDTDNVQSEVKDANEVGDAGSAKDVKEINSTETNGTETNGNATAVNQQ